MYPSERQSIERLVDRRTFLGQASLGLGTAALASLLQQSLFAAKSSSGAKFDPLAASRGMIDPLHFAPCAKRVIFLCMAGGPSQFETFDEKPKLAEMHGQPMPESYTKGQPIAQLQGSELRCFAPQHPFKKYGQSGQEICELFPHVGSVADEICIIRSLRTQAINHDPAHTFM